MPTDASPDGKWIALNNMRERQQDVFIMRPDGTDLTRLTDDPARDWIPMFSADSTALAFYANKDGTTNTWSIRLDGSGLLKLTAFDGEGSSNPIFAPDGRRLMFAAGHNGEDIMIGTAPWPITIKTATLVKIPNLGGGTFIPTSWSRDGRWWAGTVALASGVKRGNAVYDVAAGTIRQLSDDANGLPLAWLPGSTRVLYFTASDKLMIQDIASLKRHEVDVKLPFPPDDFRSIVASPDGRTLYYGALQAEANIWKVEPPRAVKK